MDGSMLGWDGATPVVFEADKDQSVEVHCLYDPEHLYLRWHARMASEVEAKGIEPLERVFTHDRLSDTMSMYFQGDPNAKPAVAGMGHEGRPGDVRMVFGIFKDGGKVVPVALGMYTTAPVGVKTNPITYRTGVGKVDYAHVGAVLDAKLAYVMDTDKKGYVLTAAIPRAAIPGVNEFGPELRTMVDFEATFGGHNKFWWADTDGSASRETYDEPTEARLYPSAWAPAQFEALDGEVLLSNWEVIGPFGGPGAKKFSWDVRGEMKKEAMEYCESLKFPVDEGKVDLSAEYTGPIVEGWWDRQGKVKWKEQRANPLDRRIVLGAAAQVWYAATWVHAETDTQVELQVLGHPQTYYHVKVGDEAVVDGLIAEKSEEHEVRKKVTLKTGWNQIMVRAFCVGYSPCRVGMEIVAPAQTLWKLQLSGTPR
jgi:hypothetical protein